MRILHVVEQYPPETGGMAVVAQTLTEFLSEQGDDVTVVTNANHERYEVTQAGGIHIVQFRLDGSWQKGYFGDVEAYRHFLVNSHYDVIVFFAAQTAFTDIALPLVGRLEARTILLPTGFSELREPARRDYYMKMRDWLLDFDLCIFHSKSYQDVKFARSWGVNRLAVIPNGASRREFSGNGIPSTVLSSLGITNTDRLILHVGSFTSFKGQFEALKIFVGARPKNAVLVLAGNDASPDHHRLGRLRREVARWDLSSYRNCARYIRSANKKGAADNRRVIAGDFKRAEVLALFARADVFLFPSNIECAPIVIIEAMAAGTAFIATDVGNVAEIARETGAGLVIPSKPRRIIWRTPATLMNMFASLIRYGRLPGRRYRVPVIRRAIRMLARIIDDGHKRQTMAQSGRTAWKDRFTWETVCSQYEKEYRALCNVSTARRGKP